MSDARLEIARAEISDERATLEIAWRDGHASVYPLKFLRAECPCANCRTQREEARGNPFRVIGANERPASSEIVDVEPIGRYGMRLTWKDGHQAGIYTFEYLHEICPCEECKASRQASDTPYVHGIYIPR